MRILTRYILGEILFQTLIGCALFTFVLFMKELPHLLELQCQKISLAGNLFNHSYNPANLF